MPMERPAGSRVVSDRESILVAGQGVVAAILENNGESWIKYYNTDGTEIASHLNMGQSGHLMGFSLSADGL